VVQEPVLLAATAYPSSQITHFEVTVPITKQCISPKRNGEPCRRPPVRGALVCFQHGGQLPPVKKAAAVALTEEKVRREISSMRDVPQMTGVHDLYTELLEVASACRQWRKLLQDRVSYLNNLGYSTLESGEQVRADVLLFERALERSAKVGEMLARLNLDERKAALDERMAAQLGLCIQMILSDLNLTEEQRAIAARVAPKRVRELTA
jgi:hypothetical protein